MLAQNIIDTVSGFVTLEDFSDPPSSKIAGDDADAAVRTILALRVLCNSQAQRRLKVDISSFVLILDVDSESTSWSKSDEAGLSLVKDIADAARAAAPAHACSSVLAGHASESDEYADVGLWLPAEAVNLDIEEGRPEMNAKAILYSLGLDSLLSSEIMPLSLSEETKAPIAFRADAQDADVQRLASLLGKLSHRFAFSVAVENVVFHFLLGRMPESGVWAGLLGVGTWSD